MIFFGWCNLCKYTIKRGTPWTLIELESSSHLGPYASSWSAEARNVVKGFVNPKKGLPNEGVKLQSRPSNVRSPQTCDWPRYGRWDDTINPLANIPIVSVDMSNLMTWLQLLSIKKCYSCNRLCIVTTWTSYFEKSIKNFLPNKMATHQVVGYFCSLWRNWSDQTRTKSWFDFDCSGWLLEKGTKFWVN